MEFASKFVFVGKREKETFSKGEFEAKKSRRARSIDDDLESLSSSGSESDTESTSEITGEQLVGTHPKTRKIRKADTNVVSLALGSLKDEADAITGDPITCIGCAAFLSALSALTPSHTGDDDVGEDKGKDATPSCEDVMWTCEFCGAGNEVSLEPEEVPVAETLDYLLEPAPIATTHADESMVVFCIDTSGSMCCTSEVPGGFSFIGGESAEKRREIDAFNDDRSDQWLPGQPRGVGYVSRLQCVQAAVQAQLDNLSKEHPHNRVAIVAFSSDVVVFSGETKTHIAGDKLNDFHALLAAAADVSVAAQSVAEARERLIEQVMGLEEGGATALGPALLVATSLARAPGSKVVLCTDGMANVGLGALEDLKADEARAEAAAFYTRVAAMAREQGTAVVTLTIKGTDCRLEHLAKVSASTGGYNDIVDPLDLTTSFTGMLENPVLATHVEVTMKLHKALEWRNEPAAKGNTSIRDVGNVTSESTLTFEFAIPTAKQWHDKEERSGEGNDRSSKREEGLLSAISKRTSKLWFHKREPLGGYEGGKERCSSEGTSALEPQDIGGLDSLPFQVQIRYTLLDGSKRVRVITKAQKVTDKRDEAETELNVAVVSLHAIQEAARLIKEGNYTKARMKQQSHLRMVKERLSSAKDIGSATKRQLEAFEAEVARLDQEISYAQRREARSGVRYYSCEDDDSDSEEFIMRREAAVAGGALLGGAIFPPAGPPPTGAPSIGGPLPAGYPPLDAATPAYSTRASSRSATRDDSLANALYQADNPLFSHFM